MRLLNVIMLEEYHTENGLCEQVLSKPSTSFVVEREMLGRCFSGKAMCLDAIARPREPHG